MSSPVVHIISIICIFIFAAGLAIIRMRLFTTMKMKSIIISTVIITLIVIIAVIIYLYWGIQDVNHQF